MAAKRKCTKPTCYLAGTKVETDLTECIACGDELTDVGLPFADLFGLDDLADPFSKIMRDDR